MLYFDVEADDLLDKASVIHLVVVKDSETGEVTSYREDRLDAAVDHLNSSKWIVAHNGTTFDVPVLEKITKRKISARLVDTLLVSRLLYPDRTQHPAGGNSVSDWGSYFGMEKIDFDDFSRYTPEMETYCRRDVDILERIYKFLVPKIAEIGCKEAIRLEHDVASIVHRQEQNGVGFDTEAGLRLADALDKELVRLTEELQSVFLPTVVQLKTKTKTVPFNPASRKQIGERLQMLGWKPEKFTEGGQPVVDESVLAEIDLPEARLLEQYLLLQKRHGQVYSWLELVTDAGTIHGRVNTNGAVTGRMTHSDPNMAQVPRVKSPYGKECRSLFRPTRPSWKMVGADASGLELRMLAHYLAQWDGGAYAKIVCEGDVHTHNQTAAGLPTRDAAKTFIYAMLYGASDTKIGTIVGGSAARGRALRESFMGSVVGFPELVRWVQGSIRNMRGLDGRPLPVRSAHSALNTLLQSAGAVVMKKALTLVYQHEAFADGLAAPMLNVHDEWQVEAHPDQADSVGRWMVKSISDAGAIMGVRCPLTGEYKVGNNWAETH